MKAQTKNALMEAWSFCDEEDKSTEFMFQYMSDTAGVSFDTAVDFVCNTSLEERQRWHKESGNEQR